MTSSDDTRSPRFERLGLITRPHLTEAAPTLNALARWLAERGVMTVCDHDTARLLDGVPACEPVSREALPARADLIVVLGGDGTFLNVAGLIARAGADVPLLGVNFGSLGFLTEITLAELYASLDATLEGHARLDRRMMLRGVVHERRATVTEVVALNDVVVTRGAHSRIIDLWVTVDDQFVARFKADGLIVASPTGSTAYNLAAGGPIVHPAMHALVLTPIAPHTLTNRPIVIPATARICIEPRPEDSGAEVVVTFDGQTSLRLGEGQTVVVSAAPTALRVVRAPSRSYFEVLRQKLKWAER